MVMDITQERLKNLLDYNPQTGIFQWKVTKSSRAIAGNTAGCIRSDGYRTIKIDNKNRQAHQLAWIYINGTLPNGELDHINGIKDDNRIHNLRDVSRRTNSQNQYIHRNGKLAGCYFHKRHEKWLAKTRINRKIKHIGYYDTEQQAHEAYIKATQEDL